MQLKEIRLLELRLGEFDVLIGINLLRGLDIPETSLVAILDADKGFKIKNFIFKRLVSRCKVILFAKEYGFYAICKMKRQKKKTSR